MMLAGILAANLKPFDKRFSLQMVICLQNADVSLSMWHTGIATKVCLLQPPMSHNKARTLSGDMTGSIYILWEPIKS